MLKKALACAALIAAATALGIAPAAADSKDDMCGCDHGKFHATDWNKGKSFRLEQDGGSFIASNAYNQGGVVGASW
ncbi:hypothetical protein [Streptomyces sp. NPDC050856]|uniref:hypothetical protein n=1 Tax=unclassified Streptomyces TaxID=2593676 RepID=UPI0033E0F2A9